MTDKQARSILTFGAHFQMLEVPKKGRSVSLKGSSRDSDRSDAKALASGNRATLERLYAAMAPSMERFARTLTGDREAAEDLVQETWLTVLQKAGQFNGAASLRSWIFAILANKARNRMKQEKRSVGLEIIAGDADLSLAFDPGTFDAKGRWSEQPVSWNMMTPERIVAGRSAIRFVAEAIELLPPAQRTVIILCGQQELTDGEAADVLGIARGNVRVLLHRARITLRNCIDREK